ncbi:MAG: RNA polymerase sigma factor RpoD/SigA [Bacteroidales bacterium]|jgi:RNA polymerase primary sigma factor|nr:RNA polymerase sigma factor RpoD/SigA [Bacteroidales bacterium]
MRQLKISQQITSRSDLSLDKYLSDIAKIQLISVEEEVILSRRIKNGDIEALKKIVQANLRFVVSVSKQYQNLGLSLSDLINEGNVGLIKAAYRFDETRGFRFISYAVWWIRQAILQALAEQARTVRLPTHQINILKRLNKITALLEQQYEREPTIAELASAIEQHPEEIKALISLSGHALSLDAPVREDDTVSIGELITDADSISPDRELEQEALCDEVKRVVDTLPRREAMVIRLFFGLNGCRQQGVEDIAHSMDISTTLVRRLKDKALSHLRSTQRAQNLKVFLE